MGAPVAVELAASHVPADSYAAPVAIHPGHVPPTALSVAPVMMAFGTPMAWAYPDSRQQSHVQPQQSDQNAQQTVKKPSKEGSKNSSRNSKNKERWEGKGQAKTKARGETTAQQPELCE